MFAEPFFEALFDALGWDTESWAAPVVSAATRLSAVVGSQNILDAAFLLCALGAGIWLHYLASLRDRSRPRDEDVFEDLCWRLSGMAGKLDTLHGHWRYYTCPAEDKGRWTAEAVGMYVALSNDLRKIRVRIPDLSIVRNPNNWDQKTRALIGILKVLRELSEHGQVEAGTKHALDLTSKFESDFKNALLRHPPPQKFRLVNIIIHSLLQGAS